MTFASCFPWAKRHSPWISASQGLFVESHFSNICENIAANQLILVSNGLVIENNFPGIQSRGIKCTPDKTSDNNSTINIY